METTEFEAILDILRDRLNSEIANGLTFAKSSEFELAVRNFLSDLLEGSDLAVDFSPHPHVFPDIVLAPFGLEVKFTLNDTWRSVANSIFEGTRSDDVETVYVIFGKFGGVPEVKWGRYGECVMHVRTSHVPRFEVEMFPDESLFSKIGIGYEEFCKLCIEERMDHIRSYARSRLKSGERLWWLEQSDEPENTLPIQARLYTSLETDEKRRLRAEATLLCPKIVKSSRTRDKYNDVVLYLLTYRGVLCHQARDLFSAGSVALREDEERGGNYIQRALHDLQNEMRTAASTLDDELFVEYWGRSVLPENRIVEWLKLADGYADDWKPSDTLFKREQGLEESDLEASED